MMDPPASDRDLSEETVRRVMREQFPRLALHSVAYLASGWEHDVYLIDGHVVVRFPRYADVAEDLDHDQAILEFVGSSVGSAVAVPKITLRGEGSAHFPHRFFGHDVIPGIDSNDPKAPKSAELASDLGKALTRIHATSPSSASEIGIGLAEQDCQTPFDLLVKQVDVLEGLGELVPGPYAWLRGPPPVPAAYSGPPRFLHNDLHHEHIIVGATSGRLAGIVDWSGAALGDPSLDFSFLLLLRGRGFLDAVLDAYRLPVDDGFLERVTFRARVRGFGWLTDAIRRNADTTRSLAEVSNAFAGWGSSANRQSPA